MNFWGCILKAFHWSLDISNNIPDKCIICVAPHTSNWDFIIGLLAYKALGRKANFLMKESWFFFPINFLFKSLGGIPVPAIKGSGLTEVIVNMFRCRKYMNLAVTPEGTRSPNPNWRKGFLYIAKEADVPIYLGVIDYSQRKVTINESLKTNSENIYRDLEEIKNYYKKFSEAARYPDKFKL